MRTGSCCNYGRFRTIRVQAAKNARQMRVRVGPLQTLTRSSPPAQASLYTSDSWARSRLRNIGAGLKSYSSSSVSNWTSGQSWSAHRVAATPALWAIAIGRGTNASEWCALTSLVTVGDRDSRSQGTSSAHHIATLAGLKTQSDLQPVPPGSADGRT